MAKVRTIPKPGRPRHFIREWRKFRVLTLEQLAERINVTHGALSQLERGLMNYTQPMLEALADALGCTPADLIVRDPTNASAPWSIIDGLEKADLQTQDRVVRVVNELLKDGTHC